MVKIFNRLKIFNQLKFYWIKIYAAITKLILTDSNFSALTLLVGQQEGHLACKN